MNGGLRLEIVKAPESCPSFFNSISSLEIVTGRIFMQACGKGLTNSNPEVQESRIRAPLFVLEVSV